LLVSDTGEVLISDFGMSKVLEDVTMKPASATLTAGGSTRWLSPELIDQPQASVSKEADTWAWGMTALECLTGKPPWMSCKRVRPFPPLRERLIVRMCLLINPRLFLSQDADVITRIVRLRQMPERPQGPGVDEWLSEPLWRLLNDCWAFDTRRRARMDVVLGRMALIEEAPRPGPARARG
jgi:serine/threonine protein kinase